MVWRGEEVGQMVGPWGGRRGNIVPRLSFPCLLLVFVYCVCAYWVMLHGLVMLVIVCLLFVVLPFVVFLFMFCVFVCR